MNQQIYERLVLIFNEQEKNLHSEDQGVNLIEHKALSNCLDCMEYMDANYSIDLDCSSISLEVIDLFLKRAKEAHDEGTLDHTDMFLEMLSGYVAMVMKNEVGGEFVYDENGESLDIHSNPIYFNEMVKTCFLRGESILEKWKEVKENLA